jgi:hypothetical protein
MRKLVIEEVLKNKPKEERMGLENNVLYYMSMLK